MKIKDSIIVKDNFFNKKVYEKILLDISKLKFTNRYVSTSKLKKDDSSNNVYQKIYFNVELNPEHFAVKYVVEKLKDYYLKTTTGSHNYFLSTKHREATPHDDSNDINCLIYLKGKEFINSGTGFYDKQNNNYVLNTHVGFKENRAIIFDSKIYHSSLQFNENCGTRYAMANFLNYETNS